MFRSVVLQPCPARCSLVVSPGHPVRGRDSRELRSQLHAIPRACSVALVDEEASAHRRRRSLATVIMFDTDHLNPYGRELALQLSENIKVAYVGSAAAEWKPSSPNFSYPLRTSADGTSRVAVLVSTFFNVLHTSLRVLKG